MANIATAGNILTEADIRTYMFCPRLYALNGLSPENSKYNILTEVFESVTTTCIRKGNLDYTLSCTKEIIRIVNKYQSLYQFTSQDKTNMITTIGYYMHDIFSSFDYNKFNPIYSNFPWRIRINKTPIDLHVSAILREENKNLLHIIDFTPYTDVFTISSDPLIYVKLHTIKGVLSRFFDKVPEIRFHLFHQRPGNQQSLAYKQINETDVKTEHLNMFKSIILNMELGAYYPSLPCRDRNCVVRETCLISGIENE